MRFRISDHTLTSPGAHMVSEVPTEVLFVVTSKMYENALMLWWNTPQCKFGGKTPAQVWIEDRQKVLDYISTTSRGV